MTDVRTIPVSGVLRLVVNESFKRSAWASATRRHAAAGENFRPRQGERLNGSALAQQTPQSRQVDRVHALVVRALLGRLQDHGPIAKASIVHEQTEWLQAEF